MGDLKFRTEVDIKECKHTLDYSNTIMMLGSCFTTEIGKMLQDYRFDVLVNPFGVLYNPASIASSVERMVSGNPFSIDDVIETNPADSHTPRKYASFFHHSSFARQNSDEFLSSANSSLEQAQAFLNCADTVIITLGTAWTFRHIEKVLIVSNCHKRVAKEFHRELLQVEDCISFLKRIADLLPDKKIIYTVSPIRHFKDGAHGNQVSKSTLLLAVNKVVATNERCFYFPSYEIMMDELRDYRFYAEDMVHPSPLAVKYIFEKFRKAHISSAAIKQMTENLRLTKAENHIQR